MRILVVGAGAIGGYFGGRLLEAGRDVTFLVRTGRAAQLAKTGLVIKSRLGDVHAPNPPMLTEHEIVAPFDLVLLSCKAYDLTSATASFAPAVGPATAILPLLNGMRHLDVLAARFGAGAVLGGQCHISTALDEEGRILHLNESHDLSFGERGGSRTARAESIATALSGAQFDARFSNEILQEMWEKWVFLAAAAGITCLMRATIGDIATAGVDDIATALFDECAAIASAQGFAPRVEFLDRVRAAFVVKSSLLTASMLRDIERGARVEADHILGDLLGRSGAKPGAVSILRIAYAHTKAYEARKARELAVTASP